MLKPLGPSVVVSDAMLARVTIIGSAIPAEAGRAIVNLFTPLIEEVNRKATALSCQPEGGICAAKIYLSNLSILCRSRLVLHKI